MELYKIDFADQAKLDIKGIFIYIANATYDFDFADNFIDNIEKEITTLEHMPYKMQIYISDVRRMIYKNYLVFFTIDESSKMVNILHIRHAMRKPYDPYLQNY